MTTNVQPSRTVRFADNFSMKTFVKNSDPLSTKASPEVLHNIEQFHSTNPSLHYLLKKTASILKLKHERVNDLIHVLDDKIFDWKERRITRSHQKKLLIALTVFQTRAVKHTCFVMRVRNSPQAAHFQDLFMQRLIDNCKLTLRQIKDFRTIVLPPSGDQIPLSLR